MVTRAAGASPASAPTMAVPSTRLTTAAMLLLVTLVGFESLAVATAMPTVAAALDGLRFYPVAFGVTTATGLVGMVIAGSWCDRGLVSRALWVGIGTFVGGLLVCGAAPDMLVLILGRAIVGLGFGLVYVTLYVLVALVHPAEQHPRVFAAIAAAWVLPGIVGPLVGGLIVETLGWRWVFLAAPPLAVPAACLLVPALRSLRQVPSTVATAGGRTPLVRALLAAAGIGVLYVGGQLPGRWLVAGAALVVGGLLLMSVSVPRLLPAGTLRAQAGLPAVIALRGLIGASFIGAQVMLPLVLSRERGFGAVGAGALLTLGAVTWALGSWLRGRTATRVSSGAAARTGVGLMVVGTAAAALVCWPAVPVGIAAAGWAISGLGMGIVFPTLSVVALELAPPGEQGASSAALQMGDSIGGAVMLAVTGTVFAALVGPSASTAYVLCFGAAIAVAVVGVAVAGRVAHPRGGHR